jgi:peroxiredoxin family protein
MLLAPGKAAAAATWVVFFCSWGVKAIKGNPSKEAASSNIDWTHKTIKGTHVHIKENSVVISISIRGVNALKPLRKLNIT